MRMKKIITYDKMSVIFNQILPTSTIINMRKTLRRTCMLMLGLKRVKIIYSKDPLE